MRFARALAIVAIGSFSWVFVGGRALADASTEQSLQAAMEARDARHDFAAARALLVPIANAPLVDAASKDAAARAHYLLGDLDEREQHYASAADHYRAVLSIDPGNWYAATARARVATLERYACCFDALAKLDAVRNDALKANDVSAIDALASDAPTFPPPVRNEALLFLAEAYVGRLHQPERAIAPAMRVAHDASAAPIDRATGFEVSWSAMQTIGAYDRAKAEILGDPATPPALAKAIRRTLRRRVLGGTSRAIAVAGAAAFLVGAFETLRRRRLLVAFDALRNRAALAFLALVVGGGWYLAEQWERGSGAPFLSFGLSLLVVHLFIASWRGGFGDRRRELRALGGVIAAVCVVAAAWMVLERGGNATTAMLDEIGL